MPVPRPDWRGTEGEVAVYVPRSAATSLSFVEIEELVSDQTSAYLDGFSEFRLTVEEIVAVVASILVDAGLGENGVLLSRETLLRYARIIPLRRRLFADLSKEHSS